jgi:putative copper export protein
MTQRYAFGGFGTAGARETRVLAVSWDTVRLFLHVLAATVWVGGQLTLAFLVPPLRRVGAEVPRAAARAFNRVAWPAFAVLIITGVWNVYAVRGEVHGEYQVTLWVKIAVVAVSGLTAWLHARAKTPPGLAVFGALTGVSALAALFLGIMLG